MSRARRLALVVSALLLSVTTGCSRSHTTAGTDPTPTPHTQQTTTTPAPPPAPAVGICRSLAYADITHSSDSTATVACSRPHTDETFAVETLPASVTVEGASIANRSIQQAASSACATAFASYIGGTAVDRELSRLTETYFLPDQTGFDRGAHWVRCDAIALLTPRSLADLPAQLKGFLDTSNALHDYGLCSQGAPGADTALLVMCKEKHQYRALTALQLGADDAAFPGTAVVDAGGQHQCASYLAARLGAGGGYTYGWTFPTAADWATGQRYGYCWLKQTT